MNKGILVTFWVGIVFLYLYILQFAYEKERSFHLFVLLAIAGNMAYDGLKAIIRYNPQYPSDATTISKYVIGYVGCLGSSLASLFLGAALYHWSIVGELIGQLIAGTGFLVSTVLGMVLLAKAEKHFKLTNRA
jgi:hypothetical protein